MDHTEVIQLEPVHVRPCSAPLNLLRCSTPTERPDQLDDLSETKIVPKRLEVASRAGGAHLQKTWASSCWNLRTRVRPCKAPLNSLRCSTPKSASRMGSSRYDRMRCPNMRQCPAQNAVTSLMLQKLRWCSTPKSVSRRGCSLRHRWRCPDIRQCPAQTYRRLSEHKCSR